MRRRTLNERARQFSWARHSWAVCCTGVLAVSVLLLARSLVGGSTNRPVERAARPTGTGITFESKEVPEVPWSIHFVRIDRSRKDLAFETTMGAGTHFGMGIVSEQVKHIPTNLGRPLAAVNGDFYKHDDKYPG